MAIKEPMTVILPERRYRDDATYRAVVDMLEAFMHRAELTPTEIREAAHLAAMHFDMRRAPDVFRWVGGAVAQGDRCQGVADPGDTPPVVFVNGVLYRRD